MSCALTTSSETAAKEANLANLNKMAGILRTMAHPKSAYIETDPDVRAKLVLLHHRIRSHLMVSGLDDRSIVLIMMHMAGLSHDELQALIDAPPDLAG